MLKVRKESDRPANGGKSSYTNSKTAFQSFVFARVSVVSMYDLETLISNDILPWG